MVTRSSASESLQMKTALVTGANKGIGHEVARQLLAKGFHVFVGARNRGAGRVAAHAIAKNGGKATFLEIDVANITSVTAAAREFSKIADHAKSKTPRVINVSSGGGQLTGGADGWAPGYCISKTALNGVTSQLAAALPKFAVNSVCPGWVQTDMGGENATRSVGQGADTIVWLATDAPQNLTGKFLRDRKEIPW
jgi:NAD(P)-dependent dehydrogenase (short-subunit alcohol dehydrogenase family)